MFFAIDESKEHERKILGGVCIPNELLPDLEKQFVQQRLDHKVFGEIKWSGMGQYSAKYCNFVDLLFDSEKATFHSICYRYEHLKYRAAYVLIKVVSWKMRKSGFHEPMYVLFDNDSRIGDEETKKIREIAERDGAFQIPIEFCSQGVSHVLGVLQLADLLDGSLAATANSLTLNDHQQHFVDHVLARNNGIPLDWTSPAFPALLDYKIHFFDPNDAPPGKTRRRTVIQPNW